MSKDSRNRRYQKNSPKSKKKENEKTKETRSIGREMIDTIIYIAVVGLMVFLILHYVGQRTVVNGDSMCNTLQDGQSLIMDKISYRFHDPERFDIVIFPGPELYGESPYYIKRIIGLPGETVDIEDGKIYIDGEQLTEDVYGITDYIEYGGIAEDGYTLGDDEYFCMGDNRPVSFDSRYEEVGPVEKEEFLGKAWIRIWPLSEFGKIDKE